MGTIALFSSAPIVTSTKSLNNCAGEFSATGDMIDGDDPDCLARETWLNGVHVIGI
jgi:hypothetical protein